MPTGEGVDVRKQIGRRFAVLRFSGQLNAKLAKVSEAKLQAWMETEGLVADDWAEGSGVETAPYDTREYSPVI